MCFTLFRDNFYKNFASSESIDRKEKKDNLFQEYSNVLRLNSYRQRLNGSLLYKQVVQLNRVTLIWIPKSWQRVNIHQSTDIARFNYHESSEKSERERNRRIDEKQFSLHRLGKCSFSNRRPFSANHRISLFGLFRKEGRRRRAKREGGGRFHEPLGEDNLTIRAKGRCCTRRCAIRFYYGNARLVSNAVLSVEDFGSWCRVAAVFNRVQRPSAFEISQPI